MEGPANNNFSYCALFFILGAGDQLFHNLKETAVSVSMRTSNSLSYLLNMPIQGLLEIVEMIVEVDRKSKEGRKKG